MFRRVQMFGSLHRPAVAVIGVWDPLVREHSRLFNRLRRYSKTRPRDTLAVLLWPHPAAFRGRRCDWPIYNTLPAQVALIRSYGIDAVLVIEFSRRDADKGAAELIDTVVTHATIAELWLGAYQSLGRCRAGSSPHILAISRKRRITVRRLPISRTGITGNRARAKLSAGSLRQAISLVGRPPMLKRPTRGSTIFVGWPAGTYKGVQLDSPSRLSGTRTMRLEIVQHARGTRLHWPDRRVEWIAVVDGPARSRARAREESR